MIKDYASSNSTREKPKRNRKRKEKRKIGLFVTIVMMLAIILYLLMHTVKFPKHHPKDKNHAHLTKANAPKKNQDASSEFDFYTLLPKMDVPDN